MNQLLAGTAALLLALGFWGFRKHPRTPLILKNASKFNLNSGQSQITLVNKRSNTSNQEKVSFASNFNQNWQLPQTPQERILLQKRLYKLINAGPEERLEAVILAGLWGKSSVLPILLRGLKDSDMRVVIASADAMKDHRVIYQQPSQVTMRPPRNVALMR